MKPTKALRHQLERCIEQLNDPCNRPLPDEKLKEILGPIAFGEAEALAVLRTDEAMDANYSERSDRMMPPDSIRHYMDVYRSIAKNVRTAPNRIKTKKAQIAEANRRIAAMEQVLALNIKRAWKLHEEVPETDRIWLSKETRRDGLPPRAYENAPYEAIMDGQLSPVRRAQIAALQQLLNEDDLD